MHNENNSFHLLCNLEFISDSVSQRTQSRAREISKCPMAPMMIFAREYEWGVQFILFPRDDFKLHSEAPIDLHAGRSIC